MNTQHLLVLLVHLLLLTGAVADRPAYKWTHTPALSSRSLRQRSLEYAPELGQCVGADTSSCAAACGQGFEKCGGDSQVALICFNLEAGERCCMDGSGTACEAGFYCASGPERTVCCPDGMSISECGAAFRVPLESIPLPESTSAGDVSGAEDTPVPGADEPSAEVPASDAVTPVLVTPPPSSPSTAGLTSSPSATDSSPSIVVPSPPTASIALADSLLLATDSSPSESSPPDTASGPLDPVTTPLTQGPRTEATTTSEDSAVFSVGIGIPSDPTLGPVLEPVPEPEPETSAESQIDTQCGSLEPALVEVTFTEILTKTIDLRVADENGCEYDITATSTLTVSTVGLVTVDCGALPTPGPGGSCGAQPVPPTGALGDDLGDAIASAPGELPSQDNSPPGSEAGAIPTAVDFIPGIGITVIPVTDTDSPTGNIDGPSSNIVVTRVSTLTRLFDGEATGVSPVEAGGARSGVEPGSFLAAPLLAFYFVSWILRG